jgi:two-component system, chemotaxis family, CheB/CheR fusion protein
MITDYFQPYRNLKVLIVEDEPLNQHIFKAMLRQWNIFAEVTENGSVAIQHLNRKLYDLIFMDIEMPVLNGYETTSHIRQEMKLDTPIIAVSSSTSPDVIEKAKACGMNEFIGKPLDPETIRAAIERHTVFS